MVFTSTIDLYIGRYSELDNQGNPYAYDHIYVYDIAIHDLKRLDLDLLEGYEVERPVFNSNGDQLIFSARGETGYWQIFIYSIENNFALY